jgi:hypothetical protein
MSGARVVPALIAVAACVLVACAHQEERAREKRLKPLLLEVDGARTFSGDVATVRQATERALVKLGYELAPAEGAVVTTKARLEQIPRWRWLEAQNALAHDVAAAGAAVSQGVVPVAPSEANAATPTNTDVQVAYDLVLAASDADASATIAHVQPRAIVDGVDQTDTYLVALGADDARRTWEQMFDAIAAELASQ